MTHILAIDPGPLNSAWVRFDGQRVCDSGLATNPNIQAKFLREHGEVPTHLVIEGIQCYGMPVGRETFDTAIWIGRFLERWDAVRYEPSSLIYRSEVKLHLCSSLRAKDQHIRQELLDRFGGKAAAIGSKKHPGPLYGVKSHIWSALAVAVTYWDTRLMEAAG